MSAADRIARAAIIARPPFEPTLEKHLASRVKGEEGYFSDGAFRITHVFPAEAEYELQICIVDNRYRPKEGEPPPPMPAPAQMGVWLDTRQVGTFEVEADHYERGTFDLSLKTTASEHQVYAKFLSDGLEGIPQKEDPAVKKLLLLENKKDERKLFVDNFVILGPFKVKPLPVTESHKRIMVCGDPDGRYQPKCARQILDKLVRRAYRRPVQEREIEALLRLVEFGRPRRRILCAGHSTGPEGHLGFVSLPIPHRAAS